MKALIAYWTIGCIVIGAAYGAQHNRCPLDPWASPTLAAFHIIAWPASLALAATLKRNYGCAVRDDQAAAL